MRGMINIACLESESCLRRVKKKKNLGKPVTRDAAGKYLCPRKASEELGEGLDIWLGHDPFAAGQKTAANVAITC